MNQFDHDKLDVYHLAIDFFAVADGIIRSLPKGRSKLADQLSRASLSIKPTGVDGVQLAGRSPGRSTERSAVNIAEGAGEFSADAKASFYRIACRSATECAAILDACRKIDIADERLVADGRAMLLRIVSMLIKLCQRHRTV